MLGVRRACLIALVVTLAITAGRRAESQNRDSTLTAPHPEWNLSTLSPVIARRIHLSADRVPAFPGEDLRLRNPKRWPKTMVIEGVVCALRVQELGGDYVKNVRSLDDVKHGNGYGLSYEAAPWKGWKSRRGPSYYWTSDGWLHERSWRTPDSHRSITHNYQYYRSGELLRYSHRNDSSNPGATDSDRSYEWFDEIFARSGHLVACGYAKMGRAGGRTFAFYFLGKEVGYREFEERKGDFLRRAFR